MSMTDKERLIKLLTDFGVEFDQGRTFVLCKVGMNKVIGNTDSFIDFHFDTDDKFIEIGAWE